MTETCSHSTAATVNSALALKAPLDGPSFTGSIGFDGDVTLTAGRTFNIGSKMDLLESGSNINWHLNSGDLNIAYAMPAGSKCVLGTASRTLELHGDIEINGTALTSTTAELNYCDGVTSAIQTQLDAKEDVVSNTAQSAVNYTQAQQTFTITGTGTAKRVSLPIVYAWNFTSGTKRITVDWETSQATATSLVECTIFCHDTFNFNNAVGRPRILEVSGDTNTVRHKFSLVTNDTTAHSGNTSTSLTVNLRII